LFYLKNEHGRKRWWGGKGRNKHKTNKYLPSWTKNSTPWKKKKKQNKNKAPKGGGGGITAQRGGVSL